jgi:energy-coupling factor transporter ATP-binding protein EcfA2
LAFAFSAKDEALKIEARDADEYDELASDAATDAAPASPAVRKKGFSSGETQIRALQEIVANTRAKVYLLDEWDANLDAVNRARAWALIDQLSARARVIEISHRDVA